MAALSKLFIRRKPSSPPSKSTITNIPPPSPPISNTDNIGGCTLPPRRAPSSSKTRKARELALFIDRNPWSQELQSSLAPSLPSFSKTTFLQTLRLIKNPLKSLQFFNWVRSNGFQLDSQSLLSILEILGRARCLNAARNLLFSLAKRTDDDSSLKLEARFFNSLISSYGRAGLFKESIKVFSAMKSIGVSPSTVTFNTLLFILLSRGRTVMAHQLFDEMLRTYGVSPDVFTFNVLIRGFCMNSMVDEGFRVFNEMPRFQCEPDVVTYNTLVDGLCKHGKVEIARNLVRGMSKRGENLSPTVVTYTTLIRGFCKKKHINEALDVFDEMVSLGIKPTKITYNTLIQGLCEAERLDKIKELLEGTTDGGDFIPDACTLNTLMNAHCKAGKLDSALSLFTNFFELQIHPDSASYSILIRGLCQIGDFEKAEELFDQLAESEVLLSEEGSEPLSGAYNPIFEYLCKNGKTQKAEKVFRQLMRRGVQDPPSYEKLIMGHCREGSFMSGFDILVLMLRRDLLPDFETYRLLIEGLLQKEEPIIAFKTLHMMIKSSYFPTASIFHSILSELVKNAHAGESAALIELMLERKVRQNVNLSTRMLILLFETGQREKAFKMLNLLYQNGYMVKLEELTSFLGKNKKKLMDMCDLLLFRLEKHGEVDVEMCDMVIAGLCRARKVFKAFSLYYELVEKGVDEQLNCVESLKETLISEGRSKEVEFVSKRMQKQNLAEIDSNVKLNKSKVNIDR